MAAAAARCAPGSPTHQTRTHPSAAARPAQCSVRAGRALAAAPPAAAAAAAAAAPPAAAPPAAAAAAQDALPSYGGPCTRCGREHWLPCTPEAAAAARRLLATVQRHGRLDCFAPGEADPRFDIAWLDGRRGPGRMLGVLLARSAAGSVHELRAFSGQITQSWHIPGWAGPVAGVTHTSPVYVRTRRLIEATTARIAALAPAAAAPPAAFAAQQRALLKRRRTGLSHGLLQRIQESYVTTTPAGQPLLLLQAYRRYASRVDPSAPLTRAGAFVGMPAGAGDCAAPKLLHAAAQRGLVPLALAEAWCGSAPGTATPAKAGRPGGGLADEAASRQHGRIYGPCAKCCALLGTLLCDAEEEEVDA